jgi:CheY-like chemotaxis protein
VRRFLPIFKKSRLSAKKRILLVDDEAGFTRLLKVNLERTGRYVVREENDALKALEVALEFKPDLILLDVVMPKMDGVNLGHQLRDDPRLQGARIIFLTGSIRKNEEGPLEIAGVPALPKPISLGELVDAIEGNRPPPVLMS